MTYAEKRCKNGSSSCSFQKITVWRDATKWWFVSAWSMMLFSLFPNEPPIHFGHVAVVAYAKSNVLRAIEIETTHKMNTRSVFGVSPKLELFDVINNTYRINIFFSTQKVVLNVSFRENASILN
jgi:hypothetical protein